MNRFPERSAHCLSRYLVEPSFSRREPEKCLRLLLRSNTFSDLCARTHTHQSNDSSRLVRKRLVLCCLATRGECCLDWSPAQEAPVHRPTSNGRPSLIIACDLASIWHAGCVNFSGRPVCAPSSSLVSGAPSAVYGRFASAKKGTTITAGLVYWSNWKAAYSRGVIITRSFTSRVPKRMLDLLTINLTSPGPARNTIDEQDFLDWI